MGIYQSLLLGLTHLSESYKTWHPSVPADIQDFYAVLWTSPSKLVAVDQRSNEFGLMSCYQLMTTCSYPQRAESPYQLQLEGLIHKRNAPHNHMEAAAVLFDAVEQTSE